MVLFRQKKKKKNKKRKKQTNKQKKTTLFLLQLAGNGYFSIGLNIINTRASMLK